MLELAILGLLKEQDLHGYELRKRLSDTLGFASGATFGSLYPALHRLEDRGWIASFWGTSENNRRARYYRLTPAGRRQLAEQTGRWDQLVRAIGRILRPAEE